MKSRTNLHDQAPFESTPLSHESKMSMALAKSSGIYFNEEKEMFRLEREFGQEVPYSNVSDFDMPK